MPPPAGNPTCGATATNHCCYLPGEVVACEFFDPTAKGNKGFCSLRTELGNWNAVHADPRYQYIGEAFTLFGTSLCGDYPQSNEGCGECGIPRQ